MLTRRSAWIAETGIGEQRDAVRAKEADQTLRQKTRERVQPKMGKIDIDYQKLHDAFFRFQQKPSMSKFGEAWVADHPCPYRSSLATGTTRVKSLKRICERKNLENCPMSSQRHYQYLLWHLHRGLLQCNGSAHPPVTLTYGSRG
jgi:hypothetical protein